MVFMDVDPIPRASTVSDAVFSRFVEEILSGRWPAGEPVPSERELALAWQINRHAVREALKRVQQAGLVRISQGGKTRVLDWRTNAGLDVLSGLVTAGVIPPLQIVGDVAVMRRTVATDAARLCARNADDAQLAAVTAAAQAYPDSDARNFREVADADVAFWSAVIDGSGNVAYRLSLNTLVAAIDDVGRDLVTALNAAEVADRPAHIELAAAIAARDEDAAGRLAEALLSRLVIACQAENPAEQGK
jgi:DNA-binding FadR family transcriptional regulator